MKHLIWPLFCLVLAGSMACNKDRFSDSGCEKLKTGLLHDDKDAVESAINDLCSDLYPEVTDADEYGQRDNLNVLVKRIGSGSCNISASVLCYACIETYPPISEIRISFEENNQVIDKTIDITFTVDNFLKFRDMHDW